MKASPSLDHFSILDLIICDYRIMPKANENDTDNKYFVISAHPASGVLYITSNNREFISGHIRLRGRDEGRYP